MNGPSLTPRRRHWIALCLAASCALSPRTAAAQELTGMLVGTIKDQQGGALRGALVRLTSSALIGGQASMTTDDRGRFRFPVLPPGLYTLDVELAGFAPIHEEGLHIGAGATLERTVVLKVGIAESIVVEGSGSRIEARSSGIETRFGPEYLQNIPTRRFSMFDSIRAAPGVSPTSPSGGGGGPNGVPPTLSAFGSGGNENLFLIDGTNFTCPCAGVSRSEPSPEIIQEVHVQSVGVSAEYGNIQGSVFNVVTRQGSDRLLFDAAYYGQTAILTAQPVTLPMGGGQSTGYERIKYQDFPINVGGPAVPGRLWFFGGYQYVRDYDSQPGADPKFPRKYEQDKIFAKLTWQLNPNLRLMQSFHDEFWVNPETPTRVLPFVATVRFHATVPTVTFGHLTHVVSDRTLWEVRFGRFVYERTDDPSSGDWDTPSRMDRLTNVLSDNAPRLGRLTLIRTTAKATLSRYQRGLLGADHDLRFGTQVEKGEHHKPEVVPSGARYVDESGLPFHQISTGPSNSGAQFITAAVFASDTVSAGPRVTLNLGVRFDHSRAISQDLPAVDSRARETGEVIRGAGTLYTWNVVSPRLGLTAKLTADGRTMLRASYGRFNQGVLTGEISPIHPGVPPTTTMKFDEATGGYTSFVSTVGPSILSLDPNTRTPRTDEYSVSVDRALGSKMSMAAAYIHKSGSNFIAWTDIGGEYEEQTRTIAGQTLPVFVLTSSATSRRFFLTNPDGYSLTYNGLVLAMEKRRSNGWQAMGSYTFSRTYGLQVSSAATAAEAQVSTIAPQFPTTTFGRDPNNLTNAYGRLPNDRPHMFRVMATADVLRTGFLVAANFQCFSGKPWAATTRLSLPAPQGDQRILLEPRGSRRLSSQSLLDVRLSRRIPIGRAGHAELLLDVLNVLNDTAEEGLATDVLNAANFGQPSAFVDPRRAMMGVRLSLGR